MPNGLTRGDITRHRLRAASVLRRLCFVFPNPRTYAEYRLRLWPGSLRQTRNSLSNERRFIRDATRSRELTSREAGCFRP